MNKIELTDHLTNLHFLLDAQEKTGIEKSRVLLREYNACWAELKQLLVIEQEKEDEARSC